MAQILSTEAIDFLRGHRNSVLATVDGDMPVARGMMIAAVDDDGTVWYPTWRASNKVRHIAANPKVAVVSLVMNGGVRLNGTAEVIDDQAKKHALWDPLWAQYFTSPDNPDYVLLKITPTTAEFGLM